MLTKGTIFSVKQYREYDVNVIDYEIRFAGASFRGVVFIGHENTNPFKVLGAVGESAKLKAEHIVRGLNGFSSDA